MRRFKAKRSCFPEVREVFSIRKLTIGVTSVGLASLFLLGHGQVVQAMEEDGSGQEDSIALVEAVENGVATDSSQDLSTNPVEERVAEEEVTALSKEDRVEEGSLRMHFKAFPDEPLDSLGLWTWENVAEPSASLGAWPEAAIDLTSAQQDDYGYYLDLKLADNAKKVGFLINNKAGKNLTGDQFIELISPKMNQVWLDEDLKVSYAQPIPEGKVRLHYFRTDGNYDRKSLWVWGDVANVTLGDWPDGIDLVKQGPYGRYLDIDLNEQSQQLGFLVLDESKSGEDVKVQPKDYKFNDLKKYRQLFVKDDDPTVYTNPYYLNLVRLTGVAHPSLSQLELRFSTLDGVDEAELGKALKVLDKNDEPVEWTGLSFDKTANKVLLTGAFTKEKADYTVIYGDEKVKTRLSWQLKDELYAYDGELGARVLEDGRRVEMTLWSPSADEVNLVLYDKADQNKMIGKTPLTKGEKGTWHLSLTSDPFGIADYRGYFYHYEIKRGDKAVLVLDPYAKSLAAWDSSQADKTPAHKVAKAAFVEPSLLGPSDLDFASLPNVKRREDAIIYEAHVRDFTSDKAIAGDLKSPFGTFAAFAERLDYLQGLGVTHIQLLPVMSYYDVNENRRAERLDEYASSNSNYNWGYDPQSYFALSGMYSTDPSNPMKRVEEFKALVNEIHKRGMGVILDVVYNHTARTFIFEDLEPEYYHFMETDGSAKTSFGGGRLGTTHHMSRRVLVDSIKYLVDTYKVDGFRFDMMGDHDAESIEKAFEEAKKLNPNIIMLGEGWRTFVGDANMPVKPADQDWMASTDTVAVFSDDIRNLLKSGFPDEGKPAFITGGAKSIDKIFANIKAQPTNFEADSPGDVIQYIAAHDNLTLYDIIAQSIKKDPTKTENDKEIHKRLRLGNVLILTSQGTPFIHSGQEYGRTKHFRHEDYRYPVAEDKVPNKAHLLVNEDGTPFDYPYYIHDSYDSSDAINHFDWEKATNTSKYPENTLSQAYVKGLIALRQSTDAFRLASKAEVDARVTLLTPAGQNGVAEEDLVIAYEVVATNGDRYAVFVNADTRERHFKLLDDKKAFLTGDVLVDAQRAGVAVLDNPVGLSFGEDELVLAPLTAVVVRLRQKTETKDVEAIMLEKDDDQMKNELPQLDSSSESSLLLTAESSQEPSSETPTDKVDTVEHLEMAKPVGNTSVSQKNLPKTGDALHGLVAGITSLLGGLGLSFAKGRKD